MYKNYKFKLGKLSILKGLLSFAVFMSVIMYSSNAISQEILQAKLGVVTSSTWCESELVAEGAELFIPNAQKDIFYVLFNTCEDYTLQWKVVVKLDAPGLLTFGKFSQIGNYVVKTFIALPPAPPYLFDDPGATLLPGEVFVYAPSDAAITVLNNIPYTCGLSFDLTGQATTQYACQTATALWSVVSKPAGADVDFVTPTNDSTTVDVDTYGTYVFKLTSSNGTDSNGDPCTEDSENVTIEFIGLPDGQVSITADDVSTITYTPVIASATIDYGTISGISNDVIVDAKMTISPAFPAGAELIAITNDGTPVPFTNPFDLGGKTEIYLSDVTTIPDYPLALMTGQIDTWAFTIVGIDDPGTYTVNFTSIAYIDKSICEASLGTTEFTVTYADATVALTSGPNDACYAQPIDNPTDFTLTVTYPAIINVNTAIKANAKITSDVALPVGTKIDWNYNAGLATGSHTLLSATTSIYLSDIVGAAAASLQGHVGPDTWALTLVDFIPGTYNLTIDGIAQLSGSDYIYDTENVKIIKIGALNVNVNPITDIQTVSGAPVIASINVDYPDLSLQNIDASVLTDARISGLTNNVAGFPAGSKIIKIDYENGAFIWTGSYDLPVTATPFLLSDVLGATASSLLGHGLADIDWEITIADVTTACTVTTTVEAIAYIDYATCYSVMDTESFDATWADLTAATANTPPVVCEGSDVEGSTFTITYPVISGNPATILTDAEITVDEDLAAGVEIIWGYNAPPSTTYTLLSDLAAGDILKLSDIVGSSAPLNGHSGLTNTWYFTFTGLDALSPGDLYVVSVQPIATLDLVDYDLSDPNTPITQNIEIYEVPDATISNSDMIFSGGTYTFSVPQHGYGVTPYPTYTWTSDQSPSDVIILSPSAYETEIEFVWPFTGPVTLTCTVDNGVCQDDTESFDLTVYPNQLVGQVKYYNAQESPMPSPFMSNYNGMDVPDYFYVSLVDMDFDPEFDSPYDNAIEVKKVEEYYKESGPLKAGYDNWHSLLTAYDYYEAAFGFNYNLDPDADYQVIVWDGGYFEESLGDGYLGQNWTWNNWGGVNATDALLVQHMTINGINDGPGSISLPYLSNAPYTNSYAFDVADVNSTNSISSLDALLTQRRAVGLIQKFTNNKPNFAVAGLSVDSVDFNTDNSFGSLLPDIEFDKSNMENFVWSSLAVDHFYMSDVTTPGLGNHYLNIYYDAVGDINASYVPQYGGFKVAPAMELIYENELTVIKGQEITIPVTLDANADLGALSLGLNYRNDLIEVIGTNYGEDFAAIDQTAGTVRIAWASQDGARFNQEDAVAMITVRVIGDIEAGTRLFELDGFTELADVNAKVIEGLNFKTSGLNTSIHGAGALSVNNYPNPFESTTTITYTLPVSGNVNLVVYNKLGQIVKTFVDQYQSEGIYTVNVTSSDLNGQGVYYYKLEVKGENGNYSSTNNLVLIK